MNEINIKYMIVNINSLKLMRRMVYCQNLGPYKLLPLISGMIKKHIKLLR